MSGGQQCVWKKNTFFREIKDRNKEKQKTKKDHVNLIKRESISSYHNTID